MFKKASFAVLCAFLALPLHVSAATTVDVYRQSRESVVYLASYDQDGLPLASGSGFFFEPKRIATNLHLVEGAARVVYKPIGATQETDIKQVVRRSRSLDVAILETEEENPALKIASPDQTVIGQKVIALGNPAQLEGPISEGTIGWRGKPALSYLKGAGTVSEGVISGKRELAEGLSLLQMTAPISWGNSGGPLLNESGEVIGITMATIESGQDPNFALPAHLIQEMLAAESPYEPVLKAALPLPPNGSSVLKLVDLQMDGHDVIKYSLLNMTTRRISSVVYLVIFRGYDTKDVVYYVQVLTHRIPQPGLAMGDSFWNARELEGYFLHEEGSQPVQGRKYAEIEFRVLTCDFVDEDSGTDMGDDRAR